jgi:hypothetical protein
LLCWSSKYREGESEPQGNAPFFFYTKHAAKPYILAIQKLNDLMRSEGHYAFINLKNSKLFVGIFYPQIFDSWGTPLG